MGEEIIKALADFWGKVKHFCSSAFHKQSYSDTVRSVTERLERVLQKLGAESYSYDWSQSRTSCMCWVDWVMDKRRYHYEVPRTCNGTDCEDVSKLLEAVVNTLESVASISKYGMLNAEDLLISCLVVDDKAKLNASDSAEHGQQPRP